MKFSQLSTDRALDVMCELTPRIDSIVNDPDIVAAIGKVVAPKDEKISRYGVFTLALGRLTELTPILLKNHRTDVYGILSALNERDEKDISAQPIMCTMRQLLEVFQDQQLIDFFKSFMQQGQTEQSAPSADSLDSE